MRSMSMASAVDTSGSSATSMSMADPIGIPMTRMGSGTTWLPDRSPMHAKHLMAGDWEFMLHGVAFVQYDKQYTRRGDEQFGAPNWGMVMASHPLGGGRLTLRGMMSLASSLSIALVAVVLLPIAALAHAMLKSSTQLIGLHLLSHRFALGIVELGRIFNRSSRCQPCGARSRLHERCDHRLFRSLASGLSSMA